jgi:3-phenylpropionate/cinnamic acid dioxygenase small subunit
LTDFQLKQEIEALMLEYVHAIDNLELKRWPTYFTEECLYAITARENFDRNLPLAVMRCESPAMMRDRVNAIRNASVFAPRHIRHILNGSRILAPDHDQGDDGIRVQTNFAVYQTLPDGDTILFMVGEYRDILVREGETLKFREKLVIYDTIRLADAVVYPI